MVDVEIDTKINKRFSDDGIVPINHFLRCYPFFFCFDGYGRSVLIRTADKQDILAS